jgi:putative NADH-flavin reductase
MDLERIARLETQVEGIKEDVAAVKDDIKELHSRITTGNREIMHHLDEKIDALAKSDTEQHNSLKSSMEHVKERVDILEKWRWMIVGGAIVIGYLVGHVDIINKFIK